MKRIFSFLLAALLLVSAVPMAQATNDYTAGTQVTYDATADNDGDGQPDNTEAYTVTVPAKLAPGGSGTVTLQGTWAADRYITVTSSQEIEMVNDINSADKKTLAVSFDGIGKRGSNTTAQTVTEMISVANITDALFGTWSGLIEYNVDIETRIVDLAGTTWKMNDHVSDDDNILDPSRVTDQALGTYEIAGYTENGQVKMITLGNLDGIIGCWYYYDSSNKDKLVFSYVPNDIAQQIGCEPGWNGYTAEAGNEFANNGGSMEDFLASFVKAPAPTIHYYDIEDDYLHNLDIIDWLYDNAVMQ